MSPALPNDPTIPTQHDLLETDKSVRFGEWLDEQLAALEERFSEFATISSTRSHFGRSSE